MTDQLVPAPADARRVRDRVEGYCTGTSVMPCGPVGVETTAHIGVRLGWRCRVS
jgi:hypothetical protein